MSRHSLIAVGTLIAVCGAAPAQHTATVDSRPHVLTGLKAEAAAMIDDSSKLTQEIVDSLFSFAELGFQEFETQAYLTTLLEGNGFDVERGVSGIPSSWWATWGEGTPVIALGSDVDGIPKSSQLPGVAYREPIVEGAAVMTDTTMRRRIVGAAWPRHFNRPIALAMDENIQAIGLPEWSEEDQTFAEALQRLMGSEETGLATELQGIREPQEQPVSGGSDDIGDVSWAVPTVTLRYPSNVDGLIAHHWSSAMAMVTPIAHKGATAGAKVIAATMLDLLRSEELLADAWRYFREEQLKDTVYEPFIGADDSPAIEKNRETMDEFKERLEGFYYDPSRFDTYLEQLGVDYPQLEKP